MSPEHMGLALGCWDQPWLWVGTSACSEGCVEQGQEKWGQNQELLLADQL